MARNFAARSNREMFTNHFWRLAIYFAAAFVLAQAADARELRIEKFDEQVTVSPNGTVDVTENITFRFIGHWNGVYREIPVEYNTPQGMNYSLFLKVKRITDSNGEKLKYESSRVRHYRKLKIYVPGAEDTTKTIVIEYTVSDALRFFDDHDEFYWNVTGDEWDMPIVSASANITLPVGATGIRTNVFTGAYRSTGKQGDAEIVGNGVEVHITAAIVDLAVRGFITIEEKDTSSMMGLVHNKDYVFHLKKSSAEWTTLKPHEQELLNGFFSSGAAAGETVSLSDLHNQFYRYLPSIKNRIFESLVGNGYYRRRPDSVRATYIAGGVVVGFLSIWGAMPLAAMLGMAPLPFIIAGILTAAIICVFGWFMPARTIGGTRALESVLGFEDFLAHVESDRFNRMIKTPEMFEKFLPFAMALGVEKNWSKAFQNIYTQPTSWDQGGYGPSFYPYMFVNNLNTMSSQASSIMASAPRSSGGSGFSGGGGGGGFS